MNLLGQTGPFAKAGRLIVTIAATAADPTGLSAAGAILDAYQTAHDALTNTNPDLAKLSKNSVVTSKIT